MQQHDGISVASGVLTERKADGQWRVLCLLVAVTAINYIDRGSLSIAAPAITAELSLDAAQMGFLLSSFFWTYATFQIVAGWLVDRYNVRWVLAGGFMVWSLATFAVGFTTTVAGIFVLRLVLGIGESVAFPAFSKIIANTYSASDRGLPNSAIDAGVKVGPGIGMLVGGLLVATFGWRALFITLGLGGLLWLIPWLRWGPREFGARIRAESLGAPGFGDILKNRNAWGTFLGNFCNNYSYYFL